MRRSEEGHTCAKNNHRSQEIDGEDDRYQVEILVFREYNVQSVGLKVEDVTMDWTK